MWGYTHPTFMDALVPLASAPTAIVGRNRIWRKALMDSIRDDPVFAGGEYAEPPREGLRAAMRLLVLMGAAPIQWQEDYPTREAADAFLEAQLERRLPTAEANDMLYQFDASRDYDPSTQLESIVAPVLAINSADDLINPPELGLMEALLPRMARCRYVLVPASGRTRGHGTHTWAALWKQELVSFLAAPPVGRITDAAEERSACWARPPSSPPARSARASSGVARRPAASATSGCGRSATERGALCCRWPSRYRPRPDTAARS
jgi:homoserine O-acetyltransferase